MPSSAARSWFITLEGVDGVGKTTQVRRLADWLRVRGHDLVLTEEPAGTPLGAAVRGWLQGQAQPAPSARAEVLLFLAARAQHVETVITPALAAGRTVLCSRFSHSTLAYQVFGLGLDEQAVRAADAFARGGVWPDVVLVLDAPWALVTARRRARGEADRIEARARDYHERVRDGFHALAAEEPDRVALIDAAGSPEAVFAALVGALTSRLG